MKKFLIKLLGRERIDKIIYSISSIYYLKFMKYKKIKKIYYLSTPLHGNMGDQAIAEASVRYFNKYFCEYKVIEVYREDVNRYAKAIKKSLQSDDLIFIIGGGNMGNLYIWEEETRRQIIKVFKNNPVISMTQTITFTDDLEGVKQLEKTKKIYNSHANLKLIAREKKSYQKMTSEFVNADILINPDIVLYLFNQFEFEKNNRARIMTCLRSDKESVLGEQKDKLITFLNENYSNVFNYDTVISGNVPREDRTEKLNKMFNEFRKRVIITRIEKRRPHL